MPPRYAYWTIIAGGLPTAFRAADRDELMPTFTRLREKHPDAEMKWFSRGKLWESPEAARVPREPREDGERSRGEGRERPRGESAGGRRPDGGKDRHRTRAVGARDQNWRPGGEHRDPRQKYKDAKKARNVDRRREKFARKHGAPRDEGGRDWRPSGGRDGGTRPAYKPREDRSARDPQDRPRNDARPADRSREDRAPRDRQDRPRSDWRPADRPREDRAARDRQDRPRTDWKPADRPRGEWSGGGESRGRRDDARGDRRPPRPREDRPSRDGAAAPRAWDRPREERPRGAKGGWERREGGRPPAPKSNWSRPAGPAEGGKRDWDRPRGEGDRDRPRSDRDRDRPRRDGGPFSGPTGSWNRPDSGRAESDKRDWSRPRNDRERDRPRTEGGRPSGDRGDWNRAARPKGDWNRPTGARPPGGKPAWSRPRGEGGAAGEPRARQDRPWRPADERGAGNRFGKSSEARGPARDRPRDDDRRPRGRDGGSQTNDRGPRPFNRKGFERNQGTEEPSAPPRPRGPNREPRPSEAPEPTPPPRPTEPIVPSPGPPERGRLVKRKRQP